MANRNVLIAALVFILASAGFAGATPFGDQYFLQLINFPVDLGPVPLTFNNPGDFTFEGNADIMVLERVVSVSPDGSEELQFRFDFGRLPVDPNATFAFRISGLEWGSGQIGELVSSQIAVDFGAGPLGPISSDLLVTGEANPSGLSLLFQSPVSWATIIGDGPVPTDIMFDFFPVVAHVPEPSTIGLLLLGLVGALRRRSRHQAPPIGS